MRGGEGHMAVRAYMAAHGNTLQRGQAAVVQRHTGDCRLLHQHWQNQLNVREGLPPMSGPSSRGHI